MLATTTLCYDYDAGHNLNVVRGGKILFDNEFANGSTYYYNVTSLQAPFAANVSSSCKAIDMKVGLLKPSWLAGAVFSRSEPATPHSSERVNCWRQGEAPNSSSWFIDYCVDASSGLPHHWCVDKWMGD